MVAATQEPELKAKEKKVIHEVTDKEADREFFARLSKQILRMTLQAIAEKEASHEKSGT